MLSVKIFSMEESFGKTFLSCRFRAQGVFIGWVRKAGQLRLDSPRGACFWCQPPAYQQKHRGYQSIQAKRTNMSLSTLRPLTRCLQLPFKDARLVFNNRTLLATIKSHPNKAVIRSCSSKPQTQSQNSSSTPSLDAEKTDLSKRQQLKRAVGQYGSTVIVFHVAISLASLGFFYLIVSRCVWTILIKPIYLFNHQLSMFFSGVDVVSLVAKIPYIGDQVSASSIATGASTFVVAYAVHKVFAPGWPYIRPTVGLTITLDRLSFRVLHKTDC